MAKVTPFIFGAWGYFGHLLVCLLLFCHHSFSLDSETEEPLLSKSEESEVESDSGSAANGEIVPIDMETSGLVILYLFSMTTLDWSSTTLESVSKEMKKTMESPSLFWNICIERCSNTEKM